MIPVGSMVKAERWDLAYDGLRPHVGILIEHMPHPSGMRYAVADHLGLVVDVLASQTRKLRNLDTFLDEIAQLI